MLGRIFSVVIDCPDPSALAEFYTAVTGLRRTRDTQTWVVIGGDNGYRISFQKVTNYLPPRWPDPNAPQQFHLDIQVDDVDAAEVEVLKLGARRMPGSGDDFRVFADPAGHPFCLVWD